MLHATPGAELRGYITDQIGRGATVIELQSATWIADGIDTIDLPHHVTFTTSGSSRIVFSSRAAAPQILFRVIAGGFSVIGNVEFLNGNDIFVISRGAENLPGTSEGWVTFTQPGDLEIFCDRVRWTNCRRAVLGAVGPTVTDLVVRRALFRDCEIEGAGAAWAGVYLQIPRLQKATWAGGYIRGICADDAPANGDLGPARVFVGRALQFGDQQNAAPHLAGPLRVERTTIEDIEDHRVGVPHPTSGLILDPIVGGICLWGADDVYVDDVTLRNIFAQHSNDAEGIYTKARRGKVTGIRAFDAGNLEGTICIKGIDTRQSWIPGADSRGFDFVVDDFVVQFSPGRARSVGVGVWTDNIRISNGTIIGSEPGTDGGYAPIYTPSFLGDNIELENITFRDVTHFCAVELRHYGRSVRIRNLTIDGLDGETAGARYPSMQAESTVGIYYNGVSTSELAQQEKMTDLRISEINLRNVTSYGDSRRGFAKLRVSGYEVRDVVITGARTGRETTIQSAVLLMLYSALDGLTLENNDFSRIATPVHITGTAPLAGRAYRNNKNWMTRVRNDVNPGTIQPGAYSVQSFQFNLSGMTAGAFARATNANPGGLMTLVDRVEDGMVFVRFYNPTEVAISPGAMSVSVAAEIVDI